MFLVTGGAGFVGSHIVRRLVRDGERVRVFDDFSTGRRTNLSDVPADVEVVDGDLRDAGAVNRAVKGCEVIFHQGAVSSVPRSIADPRTTLDVGLSGTLNVLLAARDAGSRRVVFASSSSVYGDNAEMPLHEALSPRPLSPYAISKLAAEQLCGTFFRLYGLETVALRYFNIFGPNQDPDSEYAAVIPRFMASIQAGERPTIYGDGEQTRDFVYVDNVVDANLLAAAVPGAAGGVYNIASGRAISVLHVATLIGELMGRPVHVAHVDPRPGDIKHSLADITAARRVLGYEPTVDFEEGMARTLATFLEAGVAS